MSDLPREPEAFAERIARLLAEPLNRPKIEVVGPLELEIDEHLLDLSDLYRAVHHGDADAELAIEQIARAFHEARRMEQVPLPFEVVRARILPRIERFEFFARRPPQFYAHQPFVNDTVIIYVIDLNGAIHPLRTEQLIRWGVGIEEIDELARDNLALSRRGVEIQVFRGDEGAAAVLQTGDGYDAARILLAQLYPELAPELGGDYLVAIPTRDVFVAFPTEPHNFVGRVRDRITLDYRKLPFPITSDLFLVTLDGVAAWHQAA